MTAEIVSPATDRKAIASAMGLRLRSLRLSLDCPSMAAWARLLGLPPSTIRRAERGKLVAAHRVMPLLRAVNDYSGVSLDWLVLGHGHPETTAPLLCKRAKVAIFPYWRSRRRSG